MKEFIEITNEIINDKLVLTHKILLSRIEYNTMYEVFGIKVVFATPKNLKERKTFTYDYCVGGGCGFEGGEGLERNKELLKMDFSCFIDKNFK